MIFSALHDENQMCEIKGGIVKIKLRNGWIALPRALGGRTQRGGKDLLEDRAN